MKLAEILSIDVVKVYKKNILAGYLRRTSKGSVFEYDQKYYEETHPQLSFHIKKTASPIITKGENLHTYFAGLLPEGLRLIALQDILKTSKSDLFSMLVASGKDVIGDIYVLPENLDTIEQIKTKATPLADVNFFELFQSSIYSTDYSIRSLDSEIAGVQPKISASMISFPIQHTKRNKSYILKLQPESLPNLVANEHFFMNLAKKCRIEVANTQIVTDNLNQPGLLVERFDRVYNKREKKIIHCHQEDACQFLNRYPQDKYRLTFREIAKGIQTFATAPILEIKKLLEILVYSYIIANGDLHAKNISLMYQDDPKNIVLSPAYDLLTTLPYKDQTMALNFEGKKSNFSFKLFLGFAKAFSIPEKILIQIIERISDTVLQEIENIDSLNFTTKQTIFLKNTIRERIDHLKR